MIRSKNCKNVWEAARNEKTGYLGFDKQTAGLFYALTSTRHFD